MKSCRLPRRLTDCIACLPGVYGFAFTPGFMLAARIRGLLSIHGAVVLYLVSGRRKCTVLSLPTGRTTIFGSKEKRTGSR